MPDRIDIDPQAIAAFTEPLQGARLPAATLPAILQSADLVMLHFLRHLGCLYCKHSVDQLRKLAEASSRFPPIIFVHLGTVEEGEAFFAEWFPGAAHIADPQRKLYRLFQINRLGGLNMLNPKMILKGIGLSINGFRNTYPPRQNIMLLSGTFLFRRGALVWSHRAKYAGDDPNFARLGGA